MSVERFGTAGGRDVLQVTLRSDEGLAARIITWGAALRDLEVPTRGGPHRTVLGLGTFPDYQALSPHMGAVAGRYANRIGGARFRLDGREVRLQANEGVNTLHGGAAGFGRLPWSLLGHDRRRAHLGLVSEDGDMGFPGRVVATASYEVVGPSALRITLQAFSDAPTALNLAPHNYFNLDGSSDARDHVLQVEADRVTPVRDGEVPTGAVLPVEGTRFDFRSPRPVRAEDPYRPLDVNFALRRAWDRPDGLARAATLRSGRNGLALELWTSEPGLQVYDGAKLDLPVPGLDGRPYGAFAGLALEPQRFPDGPNHAHFPPCLLRPGEVSRQVTELRFSAP